MPVDLDFPVAIGRDGLNLRDQAAEVPVSELVDSVNWRIDENGALVKRLGYQSWADSDQLPAAPLEQATFSPASGTIQLVFYCVDGHVYTSPGDGIYTSIASGLSTSARPSFAMLDDKLYWSNGVDALHSYDGTTVTALTGIQDVQTISISGTPTSGWFTLTYNGQTTLAYPDVQTITMNGTVTAGTFTLTFNGQTTANINWNDDSATIQTRLVALSSIGAGGVTCIGGPLPDNPVIVTFAGSRANQLQPAMTHTDTLTGGGASISHTTPGAGLTYAATAAQVQTALRTLVTGVACTGGPLPGTPIVVTFGAFKLQSTLTHTEQFGGGSSPALAIAHTTPGRGDSPKGSYIAVWRNRVWISGDPAHPHRVYWSDILDPTGWNSLNFVDLAEIGAGDQITGLIPAPNIGASFDGSDGLLVYMTHSTHRIFDDTDNAAGAITGGQNVLIDGGTGTSSHRSLTHLNGRVWSVCPQGIYSTDGHGTQRLESGRLGSFFRNVVNTAHLSSAVGTAWQGSYWTGLASTGSAANDLILEVYASYPTGGDQQHPVMAHTIPAAAWSIYPASTGDQLVFCDSSTSNTRRVRQYGVGGSDTDGQGTAVAISAQARSGASTFNSPHPKRIRRALAIGRGTLAIGFVEDLKRSVGEVKVFAMAAASNTDGPKWGAVTWGEFTWGGSVGASVGVTTDDQWYTRRAQLFFQVTISESSTDVSSTDPRLGGASAFAGGAALYSLIVRVTPLDAE